MLVDARQLQDGTTLQADVCIAGGGAAGITLARDLARRNDLSVVVLESGGFDQGDSDTTALYEGHITGEPLMGGEPLTLQQVRLRLLGGTTNHWAGWCRPFRPVDFRPRPGIPYTGWPITHDDLVPWWKQALDVIQLGPYEWGWPYWRDRLDLGPVLVDNGTVETTMYQIGYPRAFGGMYGDELKNAPNIQLVVWANVVDLPTDASGRVTQAKAMTTTGRHLNVNAKVFVVALGGIETPRMMLAANGGRGVGNEHDLVGRFFMEHLEVSTSLVVLPWSVEKLSLYYKGPEVKQAGHRSYGVMGTMGLTDATLLQRELQGAQAVLIVPDALDIDRLHQPRGANAHDVGVMPGVTGGTASETLAVLQTVSEQRPNPASRVTLASDVDALGIPRLNLNWQLQPEDRSNVLAALSLIANELGRTNLARLQIGKLHVAPTGHGTELRIDMDPDAFDPDHFTIGVGYHHMGTARMSSDPSQGVVDPNCRVHSVSNLYVAGSAVFPTSSASPPTFTLVALALRLGDHLRTKVLA